MDTEQIGRAVQTVIKKQLRALDGADPGGAFPIPVPLVRALQAWAIAHPADAAQVIKPSPPIPKTPEQLDDMVSHIRYEVMKLTWFLRIGNGWVPPIDGMPGADVFVDESLLEAALIHARCIAEFLRETGRPAETVTAKDYVPKWHWIEGEPLSDDIAQIHGRVAHLGLIRRSVQHDGEDFTWKMFLDDSAVPVLLEGFRDFLSKIPAERLAQFNRVHTEDGSVVIIDLDARIAEVLVGRS
ncbi:MAG: hypothetical protein MUE36_10500 [Acidimicrobiales bacterium]|nr:hypothetical protein [Acidimicrobiales bacterium]